MNIIVEKYGKNKDSIKELNNDSLKQVTNETLTYIINKNNNNDITIGKIIDSQYYPSFIKIFSFKNKKTQIVYLAYNDIFLEIDAIKKKIKVKQYFVKKNNTKVEKVSKVKISKPKPKIETVKIKTNKNIEKVELETNDKTIKKYYKKQPLDNKNKEKKKEINRNEFKLKLLKMLESM